MASKEKEKQVALIRLIDKEDEQVIANDLDVSYATVIRWKNELEKAQEDDKVNELLQLDKRALDYLAQNSKDLDVPDELQTQVGELVDELTDGVKGLARLEEDLQSSAAFMNTRIKAMAVSATTVGEISELTDALCKLHSTFFNKGTNVQILNQVNGDGQAYAQFLGDAPGS